jgi:hypothetical protein
VDNCSRKWVKSEKKIEISVQKKVIKQKSFFGCTSSFQTKSAQYEKEFHTLSIKHPV